MEGPHRVMGPLVCRSRASPAFPPEPPEREREVLWGEEQTLTPPRNLLVSWLVGAMV